MTYYRCEKCGGEITRTSNGTSFECRKCKTRYKVNKKYNLLFSIYLFNVLLVAGPLNLYIINNTLNKPGSFWISILIVTAVIGLLTAGFELFINKFVIRKFIKE